jgi:hypothetical protein
MSGRAIGAWLEAQWVVVAESCGSGDSPIFVSIDYPRFDKNVHEEAQAGLTSLYGRLRCPRKALRILRARRRKSLRMGHTRATYKGQVASGDGDTSVGDFLINVCELASGLRSVGAFCYGRSAVVALGDDAGVVMRRSDYERMGGFGPHCRALGHAGLEEEVRTELAGSEYLSGIFWPTSCGLVLGPKPGRVFAKTFWTHEAWPEHERLGRLRGMALSMQGATFVPFLGAYLAGVLAATSGTKAIFERRWRGYWLRPGALPTPDTSRVVAERYGIAPADVSALEARLFSVGGAACTMKDDVMQALVSVDWA